MEAFGSHELDRLGRENNKKKKKRLDRETKRACSNQDPYYWRPDPKALHSEPLTTNSRIAGLFYSTSSHIGSRP